MRSAPRPKSSIYRDFELVAGVDEAGRGCLAGPVVAAAVILPRDSDISGLADSKVLKPEQREKLETRIKAGCSAWALGFSWPREIDRINILQASLTAMLRAVARLKVLPEYLLVDGNQAINTKIPQKTVVDGDALIPVISAASIIAKTFRDRLLEKLDTRFPGYGLARHKGYATSEHYRALAELGPCPLHRLTFRGVLPGAEQDQLCLPGI